MQNLQRRGQLSKKHWFHIATKLKNKNMWSTLQNRLVSFHQQGWWNYANKMSTYKLLRYDHFHYFFVSPDMATLLLVFVVYLSNSCDSILSCDSVLIIIYMLVLFSYQVFRARTCRYQGVRNGRFLENLAYFVF